MMSLGWRRALRFRFSEAAWSVAADSVKKTARARYNPASGLHNPTSLRRPRLSYEKPGFILVLSSRSAAGIYASFAGLRSRAVGGEAAGRK
jgi:hypothetical protein